MKCVVRLIAIGALLLATSPLASSQDAPPFRIDSIKPHDKAVPGQIMGLYVEGLQGGPSPVMLPAEDFEVEVIQDGVTVEAKVRTVAPVITMGIRSPDGPEPQRQFYQNVRFVVPKGLHTGLAELRLSYRNRWSNAVTLTILDKPLLPAIGTTSVMTIGGITPDRAPGARPTGKDLGLRLERGATARLMVDPLVDPGDSSSAILVRFKQAGTHYDAVTRVTNQPFNVVNRTRSVAFMPARDELEVDVPAALAMGPAEIEIRVKANGQTSDPVTLGVAITDTTRTVEEPGKHAPRLFAVTPKRTGAGQSMLLSIDQLRGLEPDPSKTIVFVEQDGARYAATIERNSALLRPGITSDDPVLLTVRTSREIIGKAQIRIFNPLRSESAGSSEPVPIEILNDVQPPEVFGVGESTEADLAPLRRMYEIQREAGREFPPYDPSRRYLTIRATGVDHNPRFVRITLEQAGRSYTLAPTDFSHFSGEAVVVRLPKEFGSGTVSFSIQNLATGTASMPVLREFQLK
ncbi:MAG TPA: hypothetical protein VIT88_12795 [Pyrinomonadaceae bacterium]